MQSSSMRGPTMNSQPFPRSPSFHGSESDIELENNGIAEKDTEDTSLPADSPDITPIIQKTPQNDEIPDGGLIAWCQVLGSFFLFFNSW